MFYAFMPLKFVCFNTFCPKSIINNEYAGSCCLPSSAVQALLFSLVTQAWAQTGLWRLEWNNAYSILIKWTMCLKAQQKDLIGSTSPFHLLPQMLCVQETLNGVNIFKNKLQWVNIGDKENTFLMIMNYYWFFYIEN